MLRFLETKKLFLNKKKFKDWHSEEPQELRNWIGIVFVKWNGKTNDRCQKEEIKKNIFSEC